MGIIKTIIEMIVKLIKFTIGTLFIIVFAFLWLFESGLTLYAASTSFTKRGYSDVFDDLRQDVNFKAENFPNMTLDYYKGINADDDLSNNQPFMQIITIAESYTHELYLYVYQPTDIELDLSATAVSISLGFSSNGQDLNPKIYDLELVSTYNIFDKYVVKGLTISDETYRYYNIIALYREYNEEIDSLPIGGDANGSEIGMSVGQQWCAYYLDDKIVYEKSTFETMEIKINFTGDIYFENGITWGSLAGLQNECNAWFIAFSCEDYIVKHIYDADLTYKIRDYSWDSSTGNSTKRNEKFGEWSEEIPIKLTDTDLVQYSGVGLFGREYSYNRIMTSQAFIEELEKQKVEFDSSTKDTLKISQWVFTFKETNLSSFKSVNGYEHWEGKDIEDVTILRIHFMDFKGDKYNLGVVSDRVNPDNTSDGVGGIDILDSLKDFFEKLFAILGLIVLVIVLMFLSNLLTPFMTVFKEIWKGIKYVISIPFKIVKWVFKRK